MNRSLVLACALFLLAGPARAQGISVAQRLDFALQELQRTADDLAKNATTNAKILNLLHEANRALTDWQTEKGVAVAMERIREAKRLAGQRPMQPRVFRATERAEEILLPATRSTMMMDLTQIRDALRQGPIEQIRGVVASDMNDLAALTNRTATITGTLSQALSQAASAALGRAE